MMKIIIFGWTNFFVGFNIEDESPNQERKNN